MRSINRVNYLPRFTTSNKSQLVKEYRNIENTVTPINPRGLSLNIHAHCYIDASIALGVTLS